MMITMTIMINSMLIIDISHINVDRDNNTITNTTNNINNVLLIPTVMIMITIPVMIKSNSSNSSNVVLNMAVYGKVRHMVLI